MPIAFHCVTSTLLTLVTLTPLGEQFLIAVSNYTGAGKEDKLKFAFMAFDEEGNGVITKAELLKILKANHFASHDAEVARKADTIMAQSDKDGDGVITFDEFVIVSKKFPNIGTVSRTSPPPPRSRIATNSFSSQPVFPQVK